MLQALACMDGRPWAQWCDRACLLLLTSAWFRLPSSLPQAAVAHLFPLYMQPLREGQQLQAVSLYGRIKEQVQECLRSLALQQGAAALAAADVASDSLAGSTVAGSAAGRRACSSGLSFELPYISKFLLLAAYIASRNKPTADRAVFDPTFRKRARRDAQAHDRQVGRGRAGAGCGVEGDCAGLHILNDHGWAVPWPSLPLTPHSPSSARPRRWKRQWRPSCAARTPSHWSACCRSSLPSTQTTMPMMRTRGTQRRCAA